MSPRGKAVKGSAMDWVFVSAQIHMLKSSMGWYLELGLLKDNWV